MRFHRDFLRTYLSHAPLALAFERTMECQLYADRPMARPILDIGCGDGLFAKVLFAEKVDTGIDPNPRELERAKRLGAYEELIQCDGAAVPKVDGVYRTIFSNSVLEHIADLEPVLKEAHRLLAPGGRFYFTAPSEMFDQYSALARLLSAIGLTSLATRYRHFYNGFWAHFHYYPLPEWKQCVERTGFHVIECFCYASSRVCLLNDCLAPFALPSFLVKRIANKWVLFPRLRSIVTYPVYLLARTFLSGGGKDPAGGLVFVTATKR